MYSYRFWGEDFKNEVKFLKNPQESTQKLAQNFWGCSTYRPISKICNYKFSSNQCQNVEKDLLVPICNYGKHVFCKLQLIDFNFSPYFVYSKMINSYHACTDILMMSLLIPNVLELKVVFNSIRNSCLIFVLVYQQ